MTRTLALEFVDATRGREEGYLASVGSLTTMPGQSGRTATALFQWRSTQAGGAWPCGVNLWERPWSAWLQKVAKQFTDVARDTGIEGWWKDNVELRAGGLDRVLLPSPASTELGAVADRAAACAVFVVELAWMRAGRVTGHLDAADDVLGPLAAGAGGVLVGAYRVLWHPNEAVTIVGLPAATSIEAVLGHGAWADHKAEVAERVETRVVLPARTMSERGGKR